MSGYRVLMFALCLLPLQAATIVAPSGFANVDGNSNNGFTFDLNAFSQAIPSDTQRYQQVYLGSLFSSFGGPILITGLSFRPDGPFGSAFSATIPNVEFDLSTTNKGTGNLSTYFANNIGADNTVVFSGTWSLGSSASGALVHSFDINLNFSTPFLFDPRAGNLLLDIKSAGAALTTPFDSDSSTNTIARVYTLASGVSSPVADRSDSEGLVTQFDVTPNAFPPVSLLPEPSTAVFMLAGLLAFRFLHRRIR